MIVHLSVHTPKAGRERDLIASMHRFGAAGAGQPGFIKALVLRGPESFVLEEVEPPGRDIIGRPAQPRTRGGHI
jgi:hypothetical protein